MNEENKSKPNEKKRNLANMAEKQVGLGQKDGESSVSSKGPTIRPNRLDMTSQNDVDNLRRSLAIGSLPEDFLVCRVCSLPYNQPKQLECLHTFCLQCLMITIELQEITASDGTRCIYCPLCRQICDLPDGGPDQLPDNLLLRNLLDMVTSRAFRSCEVCQHKGIAQPETASFCCIKCEEFYCETCVRFHRTNAGTSDHLVVGIANVNKACRLIQSARQNPLTARLVSRFGQQGTNLYRPSAICVSKTDDIMVSNNNNSITVFTMAGTVKQTIKVDSIQAGLCRGIDVTVEGYLIIAIEYDDNSQVMSFDALAENQFDKTMTDGFFRTGSRLKSTQAGQRLKVIPRSANSLTGRNKIEPPGRPDSQASNKAGLNQVIAIVQTLSGREVTRYGLSLKTHETSKYCKSSGVSVTGDGRVVVTDVNNHRIHVFGNDQELVKSFGSRGSKGKQLKTPYHVKVTRNDILVSDYDNHCVKVFDFKGKLQLRFGRMGRALGEFLHPMGLDLSRSHQIVICDRDNHRLQMFDLNGKFLSVLVADTTCQGLDVRPVDVAITSCNLLAVLVIGIEGVDFSEIRLYQVAPRLQSNQQNINLQQISLHSFAETLSLQQPSSRSEIYRDPPATLLRINSASHGRSSTVNEYFVQNGRNAVDKHTEISSTCTLL